MSTDTEEPILDMDEVVSMLTAREIPAYVEQTGGGCATIYAGTPYHEEGWGDRYPAVAGPGWFEGPAWTIARGYVNDFYIGPDDDGEARPLVLAEVMPEHHDETPEAVAALKIAAQVLHHLRTQRGNR